MMDHSMAITRNNGGGSKNHLPSSLQVDGVAYGQVYSYSPNSGEPRPGDTKENVLPIVFVGITAFIVLVRLLCCRIQKEQEAAGDGGTLGQPPPLRPPTSRAGGLVDRDPSTTVAGLDQVPAAEPPPLVCTYRKEDGWGEDTSCGVCLAELADGEALRVLPACMHFFHAACVNEWLHGHDTCPLCRTPLVAPGPGDDT